MLEAIQTLWAALKSGDLQAILSAIALVAVAASPLIASVASYKLSQWKVKYEAKKTEALANLDEAKKVSQEAQEMMVKVNAFIENNANMWDYVLEHSTLTSTEKAYAKETYTSAIKEATKIDLSAVEIKKDEQLSTQTLETSVQQEEQVEIKDDTPTIL